MIYQAADLKGKCVLIDYKQIKQYRGVHSRRQAWLTEDHSVGPLRYQDTSQESTI